MTIANNYEPVKSQTNGTVKTFTFNYSLLNEEYIEVYLETDGELSLVPESDYTVSYDEEGGEVTFKQAPASGSYVIIARNVPLDQTTPYRTSSGFPADRVEENMDKLTAITQQLNDGLERAPKLPVGTSGIDLSLPAPDSGKALVWNAEETGLKNSDFNIDTSFEDMSQIRDEAEQAADEAAASAEQAASSASAAAQSAQIAQEGIAFPMGTIFFSLRTDAPAGTVVCDGAEWTGEAFPQFYNDFLLTGKVPSVSYDEYASLLAANGSVGVCALDTVGGKFKVPKLTDVFIRTTLSAANAGNYQADALQNITGAFGPYSSWSMESASDAGAFAQTTYPTPIRGVGDGENSEVWAYKTFDASRVARTADETRPKNICYRAFLQVYTAAAEASQAEVEFFIDQVQQINEQIGLVNTALEERLNGY